MMLLAVAALSGNGVVEAPNVASADYFVARSEDDAEEGSNGQVDLTNDDLDFGQAAGFESAVAIGLRFDGIRVAPGGRIERAFVQFSKDEPGNKADPTELVIRAELVADAESFRAAPRNISARKLTNATVNWSPIPWRRGDGRGEAQRTPDLSPVLQEVVDQENWRDGNAIVLIFTGDGERDAISFDGGGRDDGPMLCVITN